MSTRRRSYFSFVSFALGLSLLLTTIACAPAPTPAPFVSAPNAAAAAPTAAPAPPRAAATSAPAAPTLGLSSDSAPAAGALATGAPVLGANTDRKIIKNAQLVMTVQNTDLALSRLTGIAADTGGYLIGTRTFFQGTLKAASITFAVPVDRFEDALNRTRAVALKVEQENSSGQDVTDQYVDLQSQLTNLQATADRIRGFLSKAQTVDEALKINQQLAQVEQQIETIKGKMNATQSRAAFSTITVDLREPPPTPTPTPVFSPTPTSTPTPTPTPVGWHPDETLKAAVNAQSTLLRGLIDLAIWLIVIFLPYVVLFGVLIWLGRIVWKRLGGGRPPSKPSSPAPPPPSSI
jgi:hypothetical protein